MKTIKVKVTLLEELLGSQSANEELQRSYIASKAPDASTIEDEIAATSVDEVAENAMTIFPKLADGTPFIYDYQIRGFFKEACGALKKVEGTQSAKVKAHKKLIDNVVFVEPRQIPVDMQGMLMGKCERPLRASTPMGERVALASSETVPEGSTVEFDVIFLNDSDSKILTEWLDYGRFKGLGQWRNSGKGKFTYEIIG